MTEHFYQSPDAPRLPSTTPLVFLEGPVQGAPDWQTPFAHRLLETVSGIAVASPRVTPEHEANLRSKNIETKRRASERQVAYEFATRRRALQYGAIALWYAAQDPTIPYPAERRYGKTTPIENGEVWGWKMAHPDYPFIIGFDPAFQEGPDNSRGYLGRNHELMNIPEYDSLDTMFEATVEAVERVKLGGSRPIPALTSQSIQQALDRLDSK